MRNQWEIDNEFGQREQLNDHRSFYLVGIGGASMSALALMLKSRGCSVSGSDSTASTVTAELMAHDIPIRIGHSGEGIRPGDAVILTDAIDLKTNPEVAKARSLGCTLYRRSQLLGWLLQGHDVIAITGTHGKTTTTGLVSFAMIEAGFDPLCIEGANLPQWDGPVREGEGSWAVIEACEAYNSLRDYSPSIVVLTNLELDHEDFYAEGWPQLKATMLDFVNRSRVLVYCASDPGACEIAAAATCETVPYRPLTDGTLDSLALFGETNRLNASGALTAALRAGAEREQAVEGMAKFTGAERRLQVIYHGVVDVVDDYAHHPSEIEASIGALRRQFPGRRLVVAFQPHLYSRTAAHLADFAKALNLADVVVMTDIYPAREEPIPGVSSARIADAITVSCQYVPSRHLLPQAVSAVAEPGDVLVGMGAGTIGEFPMALVRELQRGGGLLSEDRSGRLRVAVVYGGDSAEREVSLLSGRSVADALRSRGHEVTLVDVTDVLLSTGDLSRFIGPNRPDVAFLAVHGTNAEDGSIQGLFELLHLPCTGSGIQSSAIAMDKQRTKEILTAHGLPVPKGKLVTQCAPEDWEDLQLPVIVKPNAQGSTVGVSFVHTRSELENAIRKALQYDDSALVEELLIGMEISVPVLGDRVLPPVEIVPNSGSYDFESKYTPGATLEICPARMSDEMTERVSYYALAAHRALRCEGATRTDMIIRDGQPYILEVNTLPGMTGTSLLPNSARAVGIPFDELCEWIAKDALRKHGQTTS